MNQPDNRGSLHFIAYKEDPAWLNRRIPTKYNYIVAEWNPHLITGTRIDKFLLVFKFIRYCEQYIFAVTSFAPDDVCTGISARIRVFQTASADRNSIELGSTNTTPECLRATAIEHYNKNRLLPRIDWLGNVFPAHLTINDLSLHPGCLVLPASVVHRLGNLHPGDHLCEVLIDLEFSDRVLNQQDNCIMVNIAEVCLFASSQCVHL
jgi:hypothetical protein